MFLDKWDLIIFFVISLYLFYIVYKEIENLKERISDLEDKIENLGGDNYSDDDKISEMENDSF